MSSFHQILAEKMEIKNHEGLLKHHIYIYIYNLLLLFIMFILLSLENVLKKGNGPKPVDNCNDRLFTNLASI